ncbi:hypothetical protein cypCar_00031596, partial [Cyprinus carpio]
FTYFYKDKEYWKFNNHRLRVEPGYPRSILKDFMGCDLTPIDPDMQPTEDEDVVIKLDNEASTVKAIAIVIPCVLALCLLVLIYTVFQFKRKGTPRHILYCKRSMQEWVESGLSLNVFCLADRTCGANWTYTGLKLQLSQVSKVVPPIGFMLVLDPDSCSQVL